MIVQVEVWKMGAVQCLKAFRDGRTAWLVERFCALPYCRVKIRLDSFHLGTTFSDRPRSEGPGGDSRSSAWRRRMGRFRALVAYS